MRDDIRRAMACCFALLVCGRVAGLLATVSVAYGSDGWRTLVVIAGTLMFYGICARMLWLQSRRL
jgi:hypothetical protein